MQKSKEIYNTIDLAKMYGIHPNTIRYMKSWVLYPKQKENQITTACLKNCMCCK
jgi:uncharacterized protein YjcR